jgi:hypothetical protein
MWDGLGWPSLCFSCLCAVGTKSVSVGKAVGTHDWAWAMRLLPSPDARVRGGLIHRMIARRRCACGRSCIVDLLDRHKTARCGVVQRFRHTFKRSRARGARVRGFAQHGAPSRSRSYLGIVNEALGDSLGDSDDECTAAAAAAAAVRAVQGSASASTRPAALSTEPMPSPVGGRGRAPW